MNILAGLVKNNWRRWPIRLSALIILAAVVAKAQSNLPAQPLSFPAASTPTPNARDYFDAAERMASPPIDEQNTVDSKQQNLGEDGPAFTKLEEGLTYGYSATPDDSNSIHLLSRDHSMARLLRLEGDSQATKGNWAEATRYYLDAVNLGIILPHGSTLLGMMVGVICEAVGRKPIPETIDHLNGDQAEQAARRLAAIENTRQPFRETLEGEQREYQPQFLDLFAKPKWRTALDDQSGRHYDMIDMLRYDSESPRSVFETYNRLIARSIDVSKQPWSKQRVQMVANLPSTPAYMSFYSDFLSNVFEGDKASALNRLLEVQLALRSYWVRNGHYPGALPELVPAYLPAVPNDPFSDNQCLKYRRQANTYILYSIGPDGVDDGGKSITSLPETGLRSTAVEMDSKGDIIAGINS